MEDYGVGSLGIDTFDYVPLQLSATIGLSKVAMRYSLAWPIRAHSPERGPSATAVGHVFEVEDDETVIVGFIAGYPNAWTTIGCNVCSIDPHIDGRPGTVNQASALSSRLIHVLYEAVCGVMACKEGKQVKEISW